MSTSEPARDVLTQIEAEARAERVSNVSIQVAIDLQAGAETYRGDAIVSFRLTGDGDTFLDLRGKTIERLEINGTSAEPGWDGYRLALPAAALQADNTIHIVYENHYDHDGDGLHIFHDPEDGREYLYSNFEPFEAHRLFPCFDQPDIKARYDFTVSAPADWEVVTNTRETSRETLDDGRIRRVFERTHPISAYITALVAGPYAAYRDEHRGMPIGFYCRQTLAKYMEPEELFTVTKQGLDFFSDFFDYPYPFTKYDQVFVPEFNAGAMENAGAVTHSENFVFRDPPTDNQRLDRADVMLHEMAHMWFGDLVTMKWWNDLWLNESFATYMAALAVAEATRWTTSWQEFNRGMKAWAYREDQMVTTHPIAATVPDTAQTQHNFDGITYGKGASVIKQLVQAIGMEGFREGMRRYFKRHEWGNTTLSEFLDALEEGSGRDLHAWAQAWLETASLNTIAATYELDGKRITSLSLLQTAPAAHPTLRPHSMEIALGREEDGRVVVESIPAEIDSAEAEVPAAVGKPAPAFIFPNHNDHDFAKVALDPVSLAFFREKLDRVDDPLLRQLIWQALWNMVRDQQMKSTDYLDLVAAKVTAERDSKLVEAILAASQGAIGRYVPEDRKDAAANQMFEVAWDALQSVPEGDLQIIWARAVVSLALSPENIERAAQLADGAVTVPGLTVDQDMRWEIAARFTAYGLAGADERTRTELERDPSDRGQRNKIRVDVSRPDPAVKEDAWAKVNGDGFGSLHLTMSAMRGFHWSRQRDLLAPYVDRYFEALPGIYADRDFEFAERYCNTLFPGYRVERPILERLQGMIEAAAGNPVLRRSLLELADDLERAIKCREFAAG